MKKYAQIVLLLVGFAALVCIWTPREYFGRQETVYASMAGDGIYEATNIHQEVVSRQYYLVLAPEEENPMEECLTELSRYPLENLGIEHHVGRDYETLLKIVEAEAGGEEMKGKILVANVILNRVASEEFPDTVEEVVYQVSGGSPQFTPTADGRIDEVTVTESTREAVDRAISGEDYSQGALYFLAKRHSEGQNVSWFERHLTWLFSCGGHEFYC